MSIHHAETSHPAIKALKQVYYSRRQGRMLLYGICCNTFALETISHKFTVTVSWVLTYFHKQTLYSWTLENISQRCSTDLMYVCWAQVLWCVRECTCACFIPVDILRCCSGYAPVKPEQPSGEPPASPGRLRMHGGAPEHAFFRSPVCATQEKRVRVTHFQRCEVRSD